MADLELDGATERFLIGSDLVERPLSVSHHDATDSVVIVDDLTGDDIAEVFHCNLHTVAQSPEQAFATGRMFAASSRLLGALVGLIAVRPSNHDDDDDPEARDAWRAAGDAVAAIGVQS